jgi:hypothetical protein
MQKRDRRKGEQPFAEPPLAPGWQFQVGWPIAITSTSFLTGSALLEIRIGGSAGAYPHLIDCCQFDHFGSETGILF